MWKRRNSIRISKESSSVSKRSKEEGTQEAQKAQEIHSCAFCASCVASSLTRFQLTLRQVPATAESPGRVARDQTTPLGYAHSPTFRLRRLRSPESPWKSERLHQSIQHPAEGLHRIAGSPPLRPQTQAAKRVS